MSKKSASPSDSPPPKSASKTSTSPWPCATSASAASSASATPASANAAARRVIYVSAAVKRSAKSIVERGPPNSHVVPPSVRTRLALTTGSRL